MRMRISRGAVGSGDRDLNGFGTAGAVNGSDDRGLVDVGDAVAVGRPAVGGGSQDGGSDRGCGSVDQQGLGRGGGLEFSRKSQLLFQLQSSCMMIRQSHVMVQ